MDTVLTVDGNGWSSRLHRLLTTGSMVVKMTIMPEWTQVSGEVSATDLLSCASCGEAMCIRIFIE